MLEYFKIDKIPFLVKDSPDFARRIDASNPHLHPELAEQPLFEYRTELARYTGSLRKVTDKSQEPRVSLITEERAKYTFKE